MKRYAPSLPCPFMEEDPNGLFVRYEDYKEMSDYADDLVSKIPFLPKDVDNLREANLEFATQNHQLLSALARPFTRYEVAQIMTKLESDLNFSSIQITERLVSEVISLTQKALSVRK